MRNVCSKILPQLRTAIVKKFINFITSQSIINNFSFLLAINRTTYQKYKIVANSMKQNHQKFYPAKCHLNIMQHRKTNQFCFLGRGWGTRSLRSEVCFYAHFRYYVYSSTLFNLCIVGIHILFSKHVSVMQLEPPFTSIHTSKLFLLFLASAIPYPHD